MHAFVCVPVTPQRRVQLAFVFTSEFSSVLGILFMPVLPNPIFMNT
jgi:hypothetical protein